MKWRIYTLFALLTTGGLFFTARPAVAQEEANTNSVFVIPVEGVINDSVLYLVRRGAQEAEEVGARAIIFEMDTPGGAVVTTEEIIKNIADIEVPTYTFVKYNAISAGGIIAVATDKIYMRPGSKIGDAMPIVPGQQLEEAEREKAEAYVDALIRTLGEKTGRDPELLSCMVRRQNEYKIGDEVICEAGELLTLTNVEAAKLYGEGDEQKPLLSAGTVDTMEEMLEAEGLAGAEIIQMEITWAERLFQRIALISPMLIGLGILGIWAAIYNPGLTAPALIFSACCFVVFFFGHHVAGLAGHEEAIIFVVGILLILLEVAVIPGFGLAGITGVMLVLGALLASMIQIYPGSAPGEGWIPMMPAISDLQGPLTSLSISIIGAGMGITVLARYVPRTRTFQSAFVQNEVLDKEEGYQSAHDRSHWVGHQGTTLSDLRPSGRAEFGDEKLDVMTEGDFIDAGVKVRVIRTQGSHIIVERAG